MLMQNNSTRRERKSVPSTSSSKPTLRHNKLDNNVGYQLRMAYVSVRRHFESAMARLDLTQKQTGVLWLIDANEGVSQISLANELSMDRASMMAIVDRLEERGLIVRKRSTEDGRRQELYVTAKGRKVLAQAKTAIHDHEKWLTAKFSKSELNAFVDSLKRFSR
jgi:MarR family transcriptional regulator, organic hydroperoxide resistance regulator